MISTDKFLVYFQTSQINELIRKIWSNSNLIYRQYGAGTEVPIKSLLGHRSQAPPEVRHISGQHVKEFKDFLSRYPEEFVVKEEIVYLREYEGKITTTFRKL